MNLSVSLAVPADLLVLIGGGEFSFGETRAIDEVLLARMPKDRRNVAFLPTASGSPEYAAQLGAYFATIDPSVTVTNVPIYRGRDSRRQKSLDMILSAGMVYLGGGVTNTLLETMRESAAELAMRDAAERGTVIAAIGAAASSFGAFARDMHGTGAVPGFAWLTRSVIDTGFEPANDVTLRRLMSLPEMELGLGIPARTALAVHANGSTEILGDGQIAAFRKRQ